ncbi:MAG: hypothetical protein AAFR51_14945 [Pseudomonadota bacterium]
MNLILDDLRTELEAWCRSYVTAFATYNAEAIAAHWTFPALTTQKGQSFAFKSVDHFATNTSRLLGFYKQQRVDKAVRNVIDLLPMSDDAVAMTVRDEMRDPEGGLIVAWTAAYVMQRVDGAWKAVAAVADGEVTAWAAKGTPLGR